MTTQECLSRGQLKEYLSGWVDVEATDRIEAHLANCSVCEQTVVALEAEPDTLLQFARPVSNQCGTDGLALESPIARAMQAAKSKVPAIEPKRSGEPANMWPMLGREIAGYELLRPLGRGGMGTVYVAKHRKLGKEMAIKLLPSEAFRDPHFASRFEREMRAAGGLEHPSIVRATDAGERDGVHYLVMELVDGLDLSRICQIAGRLEIADACELVRQVALGLSHAHAAGVVHRDIKPSNIVVSRDGTAKLLDFGLARTELWDEVSVELTTVGQLMGTIDYMAPEQAERPETVDYRADLYALGATLFRLLAGRTPLSIAPSLSPLAKLRLLAMHEPPSIDTLRDDVPSELVVLIAQLLARNPDSRPPSADHVAQRLACLVQGSDLARLVALAVEQAEKETNFVVQSDLPGGQSIAIGNSAVQNLTHPISAKSDDSGHRPSKWMRLLTVASLLALIVAGVLFTLDTQKGQLVVESDVPGVSVQIKQDGKLTRELTIEGGAKSTRLWAGQYEVVLSAGSDSVQVTNGSVSVMRGETQIARVQLVDKSKPQLAKEGTAIVPPAATSKLQPGDTLRISSLRQPELNRTKVLVQSSSQINLPMIGEVSVEGKDIETLEVELNERYSKFLREPAIGVFRDELSTPSAATVTAALRGRTVPPASTAPLQPGDGLTISSMQDRSIACRVIVQADHTIKPTFVGTVSVKGKTVDQLERDLEVRYSKYIKDPAIQVFRDFTVAAPSWSPVRQGSAAQPATLALENRDDEPMYDSRTLSEWLGLLRRERSPEALFDVFTALDALTSQRTSGRITNTVLEILPSRIGTTVVSKEKSRSTLDARAFELLRRANSGRPYCDILLQQLSSPTDPTWKQRIVWEGFDFRGLQANDIVDLNAWLLENVLIKGQHQDLRESVMKSYRTQAQSAQTTTDVADMLISALAQVTDDGHAFWLEKAQGDKHSFWLDDFPVGSISLPRGAPRDLPKVELYWNPQWAKAVAQRAEAVLKDANALQSRRVQAERILYFLLCTDRDEELEIDRDFIGDWVVERIDQFAAKELLQPTGLHAKFRRSYRLSSNRLSLGMFRVELRVSGHSDLETLALVELAHATLTAEQNQKFLSDLLSRVENHLFDMNFEASPESNTVSLGKIRAELEFPDFADPRNELPYGTAERWIALMIACRIYDGLEKTARDEFQSRQDDAQRQRWFASKVGGEGSNPKPLAITFERAKESLVELIDARSSATIGWQEICQDADKDGDSKLNAAEYVSAYNRLRSVPTAEDKPHVDWAKRMIGKYDSNEDGVLTEDEWNKMIVKPTKADYDNDGIITADEYARYRKG